MHMRLSDIAQVVQGKLVGDDADISAVSIDTRTLQAGQLYVAIKGDNFDGNEFVALAEQAGAAAAIVHEGISANIPYINVADSRLALAELAGAWRQRCAPKVAGVTGSNGKTTVKEMLAAILSVDGNVLYTQGNLNNDIGVPLTLLRLNGQQAYAVIEMGANHAEEIAYTSRYAAADVVVLNNAGPAHIEGFGSIDGVAKAKGEIIETLKADGVAIINRDDKYFSYWQQVAGDRQTLSFGLASDADVSATDISTSLTDNRFATTFNLVTKTASAACQLQLAGKHNVLNALAAAAAALALGLELAQVVAGLALVKPVTGRLQPLVGRQGNLIIDDTYNGNAASLMVGIDVLTELPGTPWLALGAFGELGPESPKLHTEIGTELKARGIQRLLATGEDCRHTVAAFGEGASFYSEQSALIEALSNALTGQETILVKGSRARRMENVVAALVDNFRK